MISRKIWSVLIEEQRSRIIAQVVEQWEKQYFLAVALSVNRHIESVAITEKALAFRRNSGAWHFVTGDREFIDALLQEGPVLLHEALLPDGIDEKLYNVHRTSLLMSCVSPGSEPITATELPVIPLIPEHYKLFDGFYKANMSGSLSTGDFVSAARGGAYSVGVFDGEKPVAIGHIGFEKEGVAFVFGILVSPEYRRSGYGLRIMQALHSEANRRRWSLYLLTDNPIAMSLYKALGYEAAGYMVKVVR